MRARSPSTYDDFSNERAKIPLTCRVALPLGIVRTAVVPGSVAQLRPAVKAGAPRVWEGSMAVNPYSVVNLYDGNVFTVLPIVGWSGVGPDVQFSFYHNTADNTWRTSYSAQLTEVKAGTSMMLVQDDGREVMFTNSGQGWDSAAGYHLKLENDGTTWTVTT